MNPWAMLAALLALAGAGLAGYRYGIGVERARCAAAQVAPLEQAIETKTARDAAGHKALARSAVAVARVTGTYKQREQEAQRHVEETPQLAACGLDAVGLRQWRAANAGDPAEPAAGTPDAAVPAAAATALGELGGPVSEPRRDDGGASPGLRAALGPAGLDSIATTYGD